MQSWAFFLPTSGNNGFYPQFLVPTAANFCSFTSHKKHKKKGLFLPDSAPRLLRNVFAFRGESINVSSPNNCSKSTKHDLRVKERHQNQKLPEKLLFVCFLSQFNYWWVPGLHSGNNVFIIEVICM